MGTVSKGSTRRKAAAKAVMAGRPHGKPVRDGFHGLIGSVELTCSFEELQSAIRELRREARLPRKTTLDLLARAVRS